MRKATWNSQPTFQSSSFAGLHELVALRRLRHRRSDLAYTSIGAARPRARVDPKGSTKRSAPGVATWRQCIKVAGYAWRVQRGLIVRATTPSQRFNLCLASSRWSSRIFCDLGNEAFVSLLREFGLKLKGLVERPHACELLEKGPSLIERLPGVVAIGVRDGLIADRDGLRRCDRDHRGAIGGGGASSGIPIDVTGALIASRASCN